MYESYIKRLLDLILSLAACVVLAIPMGIIALWIKKDSPGPVFFKQRRVGRGKKCFNILKFRTMRGDTPHDVPTHLLKNADSYITKSGAFLRRTSLDELPEMPDLGGEGQMRLNEAGEVVDPTEGVAVTGADGPETAGLAEPGD